MRKLLLSLLIVAAPTAASALSASSIPTKIPITWGASAPGGNITCPMPQPSQISITPGRASWTDGFPPLTFLPGSGGGIPPFGADFNGVLCQLSQWARWYTAAGLFVPYDATFQAAIGGYPGNAVVASASIFGRYYISTVDNNLSDPDTGGANWNLFGPTMIGTLGGVLTGSLPNPGMAAGAAAANVGSLGGVLTGTLPNPGMAFGAASANVGALGNVLTGTLPNPGMAVGAAAANVGGLSGVLTGTLPAPGMAPGAASANVGGLGGVLSGTLPSPGMAAGAAAANVGGLGGVLSGTLPSPSLDATGVAAGLYFNSEVNVGADGRIYGILNGTPPAVPTYTVLTSSSGTYTSPANTRYLLIKMIAGGGAGGNAPLTAGGAGGTGVFGSTTVAGGGGGVAGVGGAGGTGGGTGSGTQIVRLAGGHGQGGSSFNIIAPGGTQDIAGGSGGNGPFGGAGGGVYTGVASAGSPNTGSGGGGSYYVATSSGTYTTQGGGGAGEYVEFTAPPGSYGYVVGAGGAPSGVAGAGGSGVIIVEELYQ